MKIIRFIVKIKENIQSCILKIFGDVIQIEVGAMMVGKIVNYDGKTDIKRGEEKGKIPLWWFNNYITF